MWYTRLQSHSVEGWEMQFAFSIPFVFLIAYFVTQIRLANEKLSFERDDQRKIFYIKRIRIMKIGMVITFIPWGAVLLLA
ncbi:hypothetical protein [Halobacteriovorax sp. ZH4_bin.1]|uniref:hypothetical protein n=1 Tax=unclassified Halobacteriovorax TaxID=2639665 RepID=UPI00371EB9B8